MIPVLDQSVVKSTWQRELSDVDINLQELLAFLNLTDHIAFDSKPSFPIRATYSYLKRIKKSDPDDPLLRQILPLNQEYELIEGFTADPLQEQQFNPQPGIVHKYKNRLLIVATSSCAIHCR